MALTKKQKALGSALLDSMGNVTLATGETGTTLQDFHAWLKIEDFKEIYDTAIQIQKDQALAQFMGLIDAGDRAAVIEYQKMQRQSEDVSEAKRVKREVMRVLIQSQETKSACAKEYCQIFKCTKNAADDQFDNVVAEYGLETPHQRMKRKKAQVENSAQERFERGELSEKDMLRCMLSQSLHDMEKSEYPSERSKARQDVLNIKREMQEVVERERREAESDDNAWCDETDAALAGVSPGEIAALKEKINSNRLELTDVTTDS
ncbi:hypothetical protein KAR91_82550 [Candidatus Pacearchaeota archaeon]|nr:hypothetical protein [Candidatus Pacearchaeota archaeon]